MSGSLLALSAHFFYNIVGGGGKEEEESDEEKEGKEDLPETLYHIKAASERL